MLDKVSLATHHTTGKDRTCISMQGSIPIQQVAVIILHFRGVYQVYFSHTSCAVYIPQAKAWGFDRRALRSKIYMILLSLTHFSVIFKENSASFSFRFLNVVSRKSGFQSPPTKLLCSCLFPSNTCWDNTDIFTTSHRFRCVKDACYIMLRFIVK